MVVPDILKHPTRKIPLANVVPRETRLSDSLLIPGASVWDVSSWEGKPYRIFIWKPSAGPDAGGYPVVYLLDGNASFPIAAANLALQSRRSETTGVRPSLLVAVGYPTTDWLDAERRTYDYTPRIEQDALPSRPDNSPWPASGGADSFLDFLQHELQPLIESEFEIDRQQSAVFGHSFGGLLVLHALFTRPSAFRTYIAASPSIWFGGNHLLAEMNKFLATSKLQEPRNLLVTVGGLEQTGPNSTHPSAARHTPWVERNRMVDNARDLVAKLSAIESRMLRIAFKEFEDENHGSVVPAAISRALRFALASA
jgi:predicted alpha/beta superfamily hydrolase